MFLKIYVLLFGISRTFWVILSRSCTFIIHHLLSSTQSVCFMYSCLEKKVWKGIMWNTHTRAFYSRCTRITRYCLAELYMLQVVRDGRTLRFFSSVFFTATVQKVQRRLSIHGCTCILIGRHCLLLLSREIWLDILRWIFKFHHCFFCCANFIFVLFEHAQTNHFINCQRRQQIK